MQTQNNTVYSLGQSYMTVTVPHPLQYFSSDF